MQTHCLSSVLIVLMLVVPGYRVVSCTPESKTYQNTRKLLVAMDDVKSNHDVLAKLFKVGDDRIQDLVIALYDPDSAVALRAQIVIRYLGNAEGMTALFEWYVKQTNGYQVAGPTPLPLSDWDYKFIGANFLGKPLETWPGIGVQYIYALALDDSQQSKEILDAIVRKAKTENKNALITSAISQVQSVTSNSLNAGKKGLAKQVLDSAFFVSNGRQKHANARFLALNGMKDMALIEVYVNGGILAEEWYHVVLRKRGHHWEFFSISQVAVS